MGGQPNLLQYYMGSAKIITVMGGDSNLKVIVQRTVTMFHVVPLLGFYMRLRILSQIMYNFVSAGLNFFLTSCEEKNCLTA